MALAGRSDVVAKTPVHKLRCKCSVKSLLAMLALFAIAGSYWNYPRSRARDFKIRLSSSNQRSILIQNADVEVTPTGNVYLRVKNGTYMIGDFHRLNTAKINFEKRSIVDVLMLSIRFTIEPTTDAYLMESFVFKVRGNAIEICLREF